MIKRIIPQTESNQTVIDVKKHKKAETIELVIKTEIDLPINEDNPTSFDIFEVCRVVLGRILSRHCAHNIRVSALRSRHSF